MNDRHEPDRGRLAEIFRSAGRAHHEAFVETDGDDPEWPLWYAEHLRDSVNESLDRDFSVSEMVYLLVSAERGASEVDAGDWPEYYADFFLGIE